jgi:hypothetical protein
MKIKILAMCNVAGKPAQAGEVLEVDDAAAGYLIRIGKAEAVPDVKPAVDEHRRKVERKPVREEKSA